MTDPKNIIQWEHEQRTREWDAYDKASKRCRNSPEIKGAIQALRDAHRERQRLLWASWRDVVDALILGAGILIVAFLAFWAV